jgi:hypothetical protein
MVVPVSLMFGLVQGTQGTKWRVTTGEYNKALDTKIGEIQQTCGVNYPSSAHATDARVRHPNREGVR